MDATTWAIIGLIVYVAVVDGWLIWIKGGYRDFHRSISYRLLSWARGRWAFWLGFFMGFLVNHLFGLWPNN